MANGSTWQNPAIIPSSTTWHRKRGRIGAWKMAGGSIQNDMIGAFRAAFTRPQSFLSGNDVFSVRLVKNSR
jgi:hypothetical protein